jgi:hypothetical protein
LETDAWSVASNASDVVHGTYLVLRLPGHPVYEALYSTAAALGGSLVCNLLTVGLSLIVLAMVGRLGGGKLWPSTLFCRRWRGVRLQGGGGWLWAGRRAPQGPWNVTRAAQGSQLGMNCRVCGVDQVNGRLQLGFR